MSTLWPKPLTPPIIPGAHSFPPSSVCTALGFLARQARPRCSRLAPDSARPGPCPTRTVALSLGRSCTRRVAARLRRRCAQRAAPAPRPVGGLLALCSRPLGKQVWGFVTPGSGQDQCLRGTPCLPTQDRLRRREPVPHAAPRAFKLVTKPSVNSFVFADRRELRGDSSRVIIWFVGRLQGPASINGLKGKQSVLSSSEKDTF